MAGKATHINRVVVQGNLTRDPQLRQLPSGSSVCELRIACNTARKDPTTGDWGTKPNFFDITVWGGQGESCARYLHKGREVTIDGRMDWREWESTKEGGGKRQAVSVVADQVKFGSERSETGDPGYDPADFEPVPVPVAAGGDGLTGADDDIPF